MIRTLLARLPAPRAAAIAALLAAAVQIAPLVVNAQTHSSFVSETVTYGRNNMPPFTGQLTEEQIRAVSSYIINDLFK